MYRYEKRSVTNSSISFSNLAPQGPPVRKFTNLGDDVQQGPLYPAAKFRPVLKTPLTRYLLPKFADFVDGVTHTKQ